MKVLVVGAGGREHALCWKIRQSPLVQELYCAPGNPGIAELADLVPAAPEEIHRLADFASGMRIDLTVVGPELPLTLGIADEFRGRGLSVFGPSRRAAELEGSKIFAKEFMARHGIPTAPFEIVHGSKEARKAGRKMGLPVVVKVDGLAGGKGVFVCHSKKDLDQAVSAIFDDGKFGPSADRVLLEDFLDGEEVSFMALADGARLTPLATSKDYKRVGENDTGPNTGGMGSHSPSGVLSSEMATEIMETVMHPAIAGMAAEARSYVGVLYAGLMITAEGPRVLEFNARFGDPEAQVLMLRLEDDLVPVLAAAANGRLENHRLSFRKEAAACVVLASQGYPIQAAKGDVIRGLTEAKGQPGVEIFHAGTSLRGEEVIVSGGRVINVCGSGPKLVDALKRVYAAAAVIEWPSKILRSDIGRRILEASGGGGRG